MSLLNTIKFILNHPLNKNRKFLALGRFITWQLFSRIFSFPILFPIGEKSRLILKRGMTGATGNFYCGLHDFQEMVFLLHYLRESDIFIDVGANVGSYTVLSAGEIGAKTVCFEPVPSTFKDLEMNIAVNNIKHLVDTHNLALGSKSGSLPFTNLFGPMNRVARKGDLRVIDVPVQKFDEILDLEAPSFMKIDVEGFETEVLKGMEKALENEHLKIILIEMNGTGKNYGYDDSNIHRRLTLNGFSPYQYQPFERELKLRTSMNSNNALYIRDIEFVRNRIKKANKIVIHNLEL